MYWHAIRYKSNTNTAMMDLLICSASLAIVAKKYPVNLLFRSFVYIILIVAFRINQSFPRHWSRARASRTLPPSPGIAHDSTIKSSPRRSCWTNDIGNVVPARCRQCRQQPKFEASAERACHEKNLAHLERACSRQSARVQPSRRQTLRKHHEGGPWG